MVNLNYLAGSVTIQCAALFFSGGDPGDDDKGAGSAFRNFNEAACLLWKHTERIPPDSLLTANRVSFS